MPSFQPQSQQLRSFFTSYDLEFGPVPWTSEFCLDSAKMNKHAKYIGQRTLNSKVIVRTHRRTHLTDYSTWTT